MTSAPACSRELMQAEKTCLSCFREMLFLLQSAVQPAVVLWGFFCFRFLFFSPHNSVSLKSFVNSTLSLINPHRDLYWMTACKSRWSGRGLSLGPSAERSALARLPAARCCSRSTEQRASLQGVVAVQPDGHGQARETAGAQSLPSLPAARPEELHPALCASVSLSIN